MSTVLITYSTPPPPPDPQVPVGPAVWPSGHVAAHVDPVDLDPADVDPADVDPADVDPADANLVEMEPVEPEHGAAVSTYAMATAGIDEAIAAAIADEVARAGHQVTCRPVVAAPASDIYDVVVVVDGLHVSHWGGPSQSRPATTPGPTGPGTEPPYASERALRHTAAHAELHEDGVATTIPMTWCADWRAVDAWSRTLGEQLVRHLALRHELALVRAELERCRELLRATTAKAAPSAQRVTQASSPGSPAREAGHGSYQRERLSAGGPMARSRP